MSTAGDRAYLEATGRARELAGALKAVARDAERERSLPGRTLAALHEAGLFRILQPARVGGAELDFSALVEVSAELARGCASTAWVVANLACRHWMLAMFPKAAQDAVWGASPDALVAASIIFSAGRARAVRGGYLVDGQWPFASGLTLADWCMVAAVVPGEDGAEPDHRLLLLPARAYRVIDTWQAAGLAGTGSADVLCEEVFVPEALSLSVRDIAGGPTPGHEANPSPLYRIPVFALFPFTLSGVALGNAEGLLDEHVAVTARRVGRYGGVRLAELQSSHIAIARASAQIDAAGRTMRAVCEEAMRDAARGVPPQMPAKARYRRDGAYAVALCTEAASSLFAAAGASAILLDSPLQRAFRDAHAIQSHIAFNFDVAGSLYGRVLLGQDAANPLL
ncbi:acyl-CoA dehydrogenase family protein [Variovorax sp. LjRoot84]|uniref:acyl-CoA dehydrogenase family protein n=1 Tax=Variovorax sp. LjRoot84 TaxID=3342340 RepID=UPI003ECC83E0